MCYKNDSYRRKLSMQLHRTCAIIVFLFFIHRRYAANTKMSCKVHTTVTLYLLTYYYYLRKSIKPHQKTIIHTTNTFGTHLFSSLTGFTVLDFYCDLRIRIKRGLDIQRENDSIFIHTIAR